MVAVLATLGCEQREEFCGDAEIACLSAQAIVAATKQAPPQPQPPSGICENCNGKGKVGDGTNMVTCPICKGSGKK